VSIPTRRNGSAAIHCKHRDRRIGCGSGLRAKPAATAAPHSAYPAHVLHRHCVLRGQNHGSRDESRRRRRCGRSTRLTTGHGDQIGGPGRSIQRNIHGHGHWTESTRPSPRSVSSRLRRGRAVRPPIRPSVDRAMSLLQRQNHPDCPEHLWSCLAADPRIGARRTGAARAPFRRRLEIPAWCHEALRGGR